MINGLEGEAADENGYVTLGNLHRYIEGKMQGSVNQKTKFLAEGTSQSLIENIKIAIAPDRRLQTINTIIENADNSMGAGSGIESYFQALKQIDNLTKLDPKNPKIEEYITLIDSVLRRYNGPLEDWLAKNSGRVRPQTEKVFPGLYARLFELERYLSFDGLHGIGELDLCLLNAVYDLINKFSDIDTFVRRCRTCAKIFNYAAK